MHDPVLRRNPLDTEPCAPPCWQNITPGESTLEDVERIRSDDLGLGDACRVSVGRDLGVVRCPGFDVWLDAAGLVENIVLKPSETVTLGEIIDVYGEPASIRFCGDIESPEYWTHTIIHVDYPDDGMWLYFDEPGEVPLDILQSNLVLREVYYGVTDFRPESEGCSLDLWHGYGPGYGPFQVNQ
jgi:hypothetical protein